MAAPKRDEILVGIAFVCVGLIYALCDRWQRELRVQGVITRKPHMFDHLFLMWTLKQFLQLSLFFIWKFIDNDWLGCGRFRHGDRNQRGNAAPVIQAMRRFPPDAVEGNDGNAPVNEQQPLIPGVDYENNENQNEAENNNAVEPIQGEVVPRKRRNKKPSKLMYFPPAFFAMSHVLLLYFGLKLTYSSSFIMLKGTVAFFTALLSLAFLAQQLACYIWFGVVVATLGFVVSGISDYIYIPSGGYEKYGIAAGDLLILMAQIMFATKIIYEEKFIRKHSIHPMVFLGCEGMYGSFFAVVFLLVFNFVDAVQYSNLPNGRLEDIGDFAVQFSNSWKVVLAVFGSLISYILYTYLGMFLIRDLGALPRIMIETFVWSIYWAICLAINWEHFFIAQVPGLCFTIIGALIYSHILVLPFFSRLEAVDNNIDHEYFNNPAEDRDNFNNPQEDRDNFNNQINHEGNEPAERDENLLQNHDNILRQRDTAPLIAEAFHNEA